MHSRIVLAIAVLFAATEVACAQDSMFENAPGSPFAVRERPALVRLGHVDGDVHPDLVIAHSVGPAISTLLGAGDGTFAEVPDGRISVPHEPTEMAVGDLDGDGILDVAVGSHDTYELELLYGDGQGRFERAPEPLQMRRGEHPHTHGLALADVDADGHVDVITVNNEDDDVSVMLAKGDRSFDAAPGSPFVVGASPYPLGVGDANGDRHLDVGVPSTRRSAEGKVDILVGDGHGRFERKSAGVRTRSPWHAAIGDVTGDRVAEVVLTHWERPEASVLTYDPVSSQWTELSGSPFDLGVSAFQLVIADLNDDGHGDLAGVAGDVVGVLLGDGSESFVPAPGSPYRIGGGAWRIAVGDVNGDGKQDIVTGNTEANSVSVLLAR